MIPITASHSDLITTSKKPLVVFYSVTNIAHTLLAGIIVFLRTTTYFFNLILQHQIVFQFDHLYWLSSLHNIKKLDITMNQRNFKPDVEPACRIAEDFTKHYYDSIDKRRHLLIRLYMDSSVLIWNGNGATGTDAIGKFLMDLPVSEHNLWTLDAQRVVGPISNNLAFLIKVSGNVKFHGRLPKRFTQTFVITTKDDKWKIVSDCYRFQE